jgi:hypothetical protein
MTMGDAEARAAVAVLTALTLAGALRRSQDLTPFDMAVWFARTSHV